MHARPTLSLAYTLTRAVSPTLARALAPPTIVLAMALIWLLPVLPVPMLVVVAAEQGPVPAAVTLGALAVAQGAFMRHPMLTTWRALGVELLDRQPLPWWSWSVALLPMCLTVGGGVALLALLWPWRSPVLGALLLLGHGGAVAFGHARPDLGRWGWTLGLSVGFGALTAAARAAGPLEGPLCLLGGLAGLALMGPARLAGARRVSDESLEPAVRPVGPVSALVSRDVLALWRLDRGRVVLALLGPLLTWPLLHGLWRHGMQGESLVQAALVLFALSSAGPAAALSQLAERLGRALDVPEWPVPPGARALTLLATPLVWGAVASLELLSAAPGALGLEGLLALLGAGCAYAGLGAAMLCWRPGDRFNVGIWSLGVTVETVAIALSGRAGPLAGLGLGAAGLALASARLERARRERT